MIEPSADDALEETRAKDPNETVLPPQPLPEDHFTPAAAETNPLYLNLEHPVTDSNIDKDELYGEGLVSAASIEDAEETLVPNKGRQAEQYKW